MNNNQIRMDIEELNVKVLELQKDFQALTHSSRTVKGQVEEIYSVIYKDSDNFMSRLSKIEGYVQTLTEGDKERKEEQKSVKLMVLTALVGLLISNFGFYWTSQSTDPDKIREIIEVIREDPSILNN